jgi:two-component system OmpR family sensor kinase
MRRLPIRARVAAAFALAMTAVLAGTGLFVYAQLGNDLANGLDQDLRLRAQDVSALISSSKISLARESSSRLIEPGESFAQLLDLKARVADTTLSLGHTPLLSTSQVAAASRGTRFFNRPSVHGLDEPARLLALPVGRSGKRYVLVVGATRENRAEALGSLRTELLIAGPLALVLATFIGYLLTGAGLRAVDAMCRRAGEISAERAGERLPVPRTGDELQRLGETLNAMLARLEEGLERQRGFVAEAGHELRTPLALLRAELDYALHYAEDEDELRGAVRTAGEETDRLAQLASGLLLIASADQGQLPLRVEVVHTGEVLQSVTQRFAWRAQADGRTLATAATQDVVLEGDRIRLEQALGNLLDNALRYGKGTVTLSAVRAGPRVELHVRDEGPGFPPEFLEHAFERFSRAAESRAAPGAGLGLAIVATIARAHGGSAAAGNAADGGADVAILLPIAQPAGSSTLNRPPSAPSSITTSPPAARASRRASGSPSPAP